MLTERKVEVGIVGREKPKHKGRLGRMWGESVTRLVWKVGDSFPKGRRRAVKAEMLKHNQSGNFS